MQTPFRLLCLLAALCALAPVANAQSWPARPIRLLVAYPTGGISDAVARILAEKVAGPLGVPVVVENRAGAGGSIAMDAAAKATPDGYTLVFASVSPLVLNPHLGSTPYDARKDIVPVLEVMYAPVVLLATSALPVTDFRAFLAQAKARPGAMRWATSGIATIGHITLEQLKAATGADITHIPYKGGGQQLTDALSGQFEVFSTNLGSALLAQVSAGKLKPLAVGAPRRVETLPQVPTFAELGLPKANLTSTFGIFVAAATPPAIVARLNTEFNKALAAPDVRARMLKGDNIPTGGTSAEFAAAIAQDFESYGRIVRDAGIKAE